MRVFLVSLRRNSTKKSFLCAVFGWNTFVRVITYADSVKSISKIQAVSNTILFSGGFWCTVLEEWIIFGIPNFTAVCRRETRWNVMKSRQLRYLRAVYTSEDFPSAYREMIFAYVNENSVRISFFCVWGEDFRRGEKEEETRVDARFYRSTYFTVRCGFFFFRFLFRRFEYVGIVLVVIWREMVFCSRNFVHESFSRLSHVRTIRYGSDIVYGRRKRTVVMVKWWSFISRIL